MYIFILVFITCDLDLCVTFVPLHRHNRYIMVSSPTNHHDPSLVTSPPPSSTQPTPSLHPEIWQLVFPHACKSLQSLDRATRICKSVRQYCFRSPAAKARFLIKIYGKELVIAKSFQSSALMRYGDAHEVLGCLLAFGARGVCNNDQL
jgi:hypothetical protein